MKKDSSNKLLSNITFITSLGDFLSNFVILSILFSETRSDLKSANIYRVEILAIILSGLVLAKFVNKYGARSLIVKTQMFSFILSVFIIAFFEFKFGVWLYFGSYFLLKISEEVFKASREVASKVLGGIENQRSLQAEIMIGFFSAQLMGPLISVFLIKSFPIEIPLILDSLSFLVCAIMAKRLPYKTEVKEASFISNESFIKSLFKPLGYLNNFPKLKRIFLIRSIGHAIPIGLFNFTVFLVVSSKFQRDIIETAYIYSATGAGGLIAGNLLIHKKLLTQIPDRIICFIALLLMGLFELAFISVNYFPLAVFLNFLIGISMATGGISSQSIRRKLTTSEQFKEIVGLEIFIAKLVELSVATVAFYFISRNLIDKSFGILFASISLIAVGFFYLISKELDN